MKQTYPGGTVRYSIRLSRIEKQLLDAKAKKLCEGNANALVNSIIDYAVHELQTEYASPSLYFYSDTLKYSDTQRCYMVNLRIRRQNYDYLRMNLIPIAAVIKEGLR